MKTKYPVFHLNHSLLILAFLSMSLISFTSCESDDTLSETEAVKASLFLDQETATLDIGDEILLTPDWEPQDRIIELSYEWTTDNPEVVRLIPNEDYSVRVFARSEGTATVTFQSTDGNFEVQSEITVNEFTSDDVIKVLTIGNSFSEDAVENYLYDLAEEENISIMIGNAAIGGASLDLHWNNADENSASYSYRKIDTNGEKTTQTNVTLREAIIDEEWDYISFQQVSNNSGRYETFITPLPLLVEYAKGWRTNPEVRFLLHQTWAYSQTSTHSGFANYDNDQMTMYESIVDAVRRAQELTDIDYVVPVGTAIQNARTSIVGDNLTRDGYHLDLDIGRYIAASTWFEALTGEHVEDNPYKPDALTEFEAELAQYAAHYAILQPDEVTEMVDYQPGSLGPLTAPVFINFGQATHPGWNTLDNYIEASIPALKDENEDYTNIYVELTERFNNQNTAGGHSATTPWNMPEEVANGAYFGNSYGVYEGLEIKESKLKFSGFDKDLTYDLCFFGSRAGATDNRETTYIATGLNEVEATLQTSNNTSNLACTNGIQPNENGEITVTVTAGENNNSSGGFFFINAMRISSGD